MTDMARKMSAWSLLSHDFDSWSQNLSKVYTLNSKMSFQRGEKFKEEEDITSEIFQVASLLVYTHRYRHIRVEDFRVLFSIRYTYIFSFLLNLNPNTKKKYWQKLFFSRRFPIWIFYFENDPFLWYGMIWKYLTLTVCCEI